MKQLKLLEFDKQKLILAKEQEKEIAALYSKWAKDIETRLNNEVFPKRTAGLQKLYLNDLKKQLKNASKQVTKNEYSQIVGGMKASSELVTKANQKFLSNLGFKQDFINAAFSHVPENVINRIITGKVYKTKWSLSKAIWGDSEKALKDIYTIVGAGVAEQKPIYDISKDLERYVNPKAKKPWNKKVSYVTKTGETKTDWLFKGKIDYNAQRLSRTLIQHSYEQSLIETCEPNPFIKGYIWVANGSRPCELCADMDGSFFAKDEGLPLDHPNGMCTFEPVIDNEKDIQNRLADWYKADEGYDKELDTFAKEAGYSALKSANAGGTIAQAVLDNSIYNNVAQTAKQTVQIGKGKGAGIKATNEIENNMKKFFKSKGFNENKSWSYNDWLMSITDQDMDDILKVIKSTNIQKYSDEFNVAMQKFFKKYKNLMKLEREAKKAQAIQKIDVELAPQYKQKLDIEQMLFKEMETAKGGKITKYDDWLDEIQKLNIEDYIMEYIGKDPKGTSYSMQLKYLEAFYKKYIERYVKGVKAQAVKAVKQTTQVKGLTASEQKEFERYDYLKEKYKAFSIDKFLKDSFQTDEELEQFFLDKQFNIEEILKYYYRDVVKVPDKEDIDILIKHICNKDKFAARKYEKFEKSLLTKQKKDNAAWCKTVDESMQRYGAKADDDWKNLYTDAERKELYGYTQAPDPYNMGTQGFETGKGYGTRHFKGVGRVDLDDPLRQAGKSLEERIHDLESAIQKTTQKEDIWVQRGCRETVACRFLGLSPEEFIRVYTQKDAIKEISQKLNNKEIIGYGFFSSGAAKGTGFSSNPFIFNVFCPKGTRMVYTNTFGAYANSSENEFILQRMTKFKVKKVRFNHKDSKWYIDLEVVAQKV